MARSRDVVVVTGAGGMGTAVARRIGSGAIVVLADVSDRALESPVSALRANGYEVVPVVVDVGDAASVQALADDAEGRGRIAAVVHTAGLSPVQASVEAIMRVDLLGTALVLDAFGAVIGSGGAGVVISSMAGTMATLDPGVERQLAVTPTERLLDLPDLAPGALPDPATAYCVAKRANQVRVRAAATAWGRRGARVNSISPGVISTSMGAAELEGPSGDTMRGMIAASATGRVGTPEDIAGVVDFLVGHDAGFVTGTDVLVDGGVVAALHGPPS